GDGLAAADEDPGGCSGDVDWGGLIRGDAHGMGDAQQGRWVDVGPGGGDYGGGEAVGVVVVRDRAGERDTDQVGAAGDSL
ncbi:MAG: hypothetical protein ACK559_22725, partial [bacterium]